VSIQVQVLNLSGPTSLQFGLGTFFLTGLSQSVAFASLFLFISYKPHFMLVYPYFHAYTPKIMHFFAWKMEHPRCWLTLYLYLRGGQHAVQRWGRNQSRRNVQPGHNQKVI